MSEPASPTIAPDFSGDLNAAAADLTTSISNHVRPVAVELDDLDSTSDLLSGPIVEEPTAASAAVHDGAHLDSTNSVVDNGHAEPHDVSTMSATELAMSLTDDEAEPTGSTGSPVLHPVPDGLVPPSSTPAPIADSAIPSGTEESDASRESSDDDCNTDFAPENDMMADLDNIHHSSNEESIHGSVGHYSSEEGDLSLTDTDEEMRNFFPATRCGFKEVAGKVTRVTRADFDDSHRRRHLECFARSMDNWRNFERRASQSANDPLFSELHFNRYEDIFVNIDVNTMSTLDQFIYHLLSSSEDTMDQNKLNSVMSRLRRQFHISPSKREIFERLMQLQRAAEQSRSSASAVPGTPDGRPGEEAAPQAVKYDTNMQQLLRNKSVRSNSGVVVITVLTAPGNFSCSADCYYCPNEPGQPRSYLSTEPAVLRANQNDFDAVKQFYDRAMTLYRNGHVIDKIEILVLGGTWSGYPRQYQEEFCRDLYYAANIFPSPFETGRPRQSLAAEQDMNVRAQCRIIGLTLETRPDRITPNEIRILRNLGCTRVQLGIQHTDDQVLNYVNRGHTLSDATRALYLLKENCYKVDIHLMPDLPSSNPSMDLEMFALVLGDESLQADQWKIYPCEVTPFSRIEQWYKEGKFVPYFDVDPNLLMNLVMRVKRAVHPWIRLNRVIRDIPNPSIIGGTNVTNMRQLLLTSLQKRGLMCCCIRCREIKVGNASSGPKLMVRQYPSTGGDEYFLSYESQDESKIYGFLRLRLRNHAGYNPAVSQFRCLEGCALVRELHVYGVVVAHGKSVKDATPYQHRGIGASLLLVAEILAAAKGFRRMAVIAGIGTREYYAKHGYVVEDTFMTKTLSLDSMKARFTRQKELESESSVQIPYSITVYVVDLQDAVRTLRQPLPEAVEGKDLPPVVPPQTAGKTFSINVPRFFRHTAAHFDECLDYTKAANTAFDGYLSYWDQASDYLCRSLRFVRDRPIFLASVAFFGLVCMSQLRRKPRP
ncbi:histone acethyltransferase-like protein [Babesia caballi]|uniref:tRNA carboxymethyluridine synthase n=1 Tax=Babesia caballi TaxID=5871 RepID=A0AAV4LU80_BABCB|nr:histone acethyltransferase-like protein [Babesia caballi]